MQDIRLLPIGCILIVVRSPQAENVQRTVYDGITTNETYTSVGLYVGPSLSTPGAARVAVMSNSRCLILITNNFRAGTDGGLLLAAGEEGASVCFAVGETDAAV